MQPKVSIPIAGRGGWLCVALAVALHASAAAQTEPSDGGLLVGSGDAARNRAEKPQRIRLPNPGLYKAAYFVRLAGKLCGVPTRIIDDRIRELKIPLADPVARNKLTLEELKVFLAVHRIYIFETEQAETGQVIVATTNPAWEPTLPRFVQIVTVEPAAFNRVWSALEIAIAKHNAARPKGDAGVIGIPVQALGKILLRAPSRETLATLVSLGKEKTALPRNRIRLRSYTATYRRAVDLRDEVLSELTEGERARIRIVLRRRGNRLLIRAPASLCEYLLEALQKRDKLRVRVR